MPDRSRIEKGLYWDVAWNPITGCSPASDGCTNCWAGSQVMSGRTPAVHGSTDFSQVRFHPERLNAPLRWKKPRRVFVCNMGDLFHESVPHENIVSVFSQIEAAPQHTFMVLTKRPDRMLYHFRGGLSRKFPVLPNLWLGVTVESPEWLWRLDDLRSIHAALRFVSFEPLLADVGKVDFTGIGWAIIGCESGPKARPMAEDWARGIVRQCLDAGVPAFMKQIHRMTPFGGLRVSKDMDEWPEDLRVREFPK